MARQKLKKVTIKRKWEDYFPGMDLHEKPSIEITDDGVTISGLAFGEYRPEGRWFTAQELAKIRGVTTAAIYTSAESRPATASEKLEHPRIHYMYR